MIIELFGPPGSGKTTFASALAARLRDSGYLSELVISYRPAEQLTFESPCAADRSRLSAAAVRRLTRAVAETLTLVRHPLVNLHDLSTALQLIRILPPQNPIWSIRLIQYLSRLSHSWYRSSATGRVLVFDQAYVQAICSLAVLARCTGHVELAHALDVAPKSNLLIRIDASRETLAARLWERHRMQDSVERLLEFDLQRNFQTIEIVDRLHELLRARSRPVICVSSLDTRSLREGIEKIERLLTQKDAARYAAHVP